MVVLILLKSSIQRGHERYLNEKAIRLNKLKTTTCSCISYFYHFGHKHAINTLRLGSNRMAIEHGAWVLIHNGKLSLVELCSFIFCTHRKMDEYLRSPIMNWKDGGKNTMFTITGLV
ncbi:hypothetical protein GOP47_0025621 [Adiantum capillus-veneris]|uniref:Uncharacterized protein n=1 Tax=Adiantum capillus-veneris TaxID=13818 RepID=A0A9D4Z3Q5_ADICA|nr:hypothetical protein GOP47_0025621 [Adiantum capillus-veneris]